MARTNKLQEALDEADRLKKELELNKRLEAERLKSDSSYARKMVEVGFVSLVIIMAMVALSFILIRTGLPKP